MAIDLIVLFLQYGNDPKHTVNAVKDYLKRKTAYDVTLSVMDWSLPESGLHYYRRNTGSS